MNRLKYYYTVSIFFFTVLTVSAQRNSYPYPDSIRIEFPDHKALIVFQIQDFRRDKEVIKNFPSMLNGLVDFIGKSVNSQNMEGPQKIDVVYLPEEKKEVFLKNSSSTFDPDTRREITIQKQDKPLTHLSVKDSTITQLLTPGIDITIKAEQFRITLYAYNFDALKALAQENFNTIVNTVETEVATETITRKGIRARIVYKQNEVVFSKVDYTFPADMLGLHAAAGVGTFRDKIYPELSFSTALYFVNRFNKLRQRVELSYELKFFTGRTSEGRYQTLTNSFLSLSYARNFAKDRPRWTGFGIGYLLNSKGDFYNGKTLKFFLESDIGSSKLNLVPEFYLTDDFKKFAFGLKLNYKF